MIRLVFKRSNGELRELGNYKTFKDAYKVMMDFINNHKYKSYYQRYYPIYEEGYVNCDVGSWSEFFRFYGDIDDILCQISSKNKEILENTY